MCVLSGFNRIAIHSPCNRSYGWHQDKDAQALHWCPGAGFTKPLRLTKAGLTNAFVVCTSQVDSESLALVRRKGFVKPAPGIPTSTLFIISTPSTTYSHDTSVCSRSTVIRNKRYYYYYFHFFFFPVYLIQNTPDPLSVFTAYLILYPRISRTLRFRAVSSRRRRRSLTSGHSRTSSAASPTGRRRCLRRRRMTMTRPTCWPSTLRNTTCGSPTSSRVSGTTRTPAGSAGTSSWRHYWCADRRQR